MVSSGTDKAAMKLGSILCSPALILALVSIALLGALVPAFTLPVGPFYWDLYIYFDAANRIFDGQVPAVDFFTPVGPLGYWLFALFVRLFPDGQPLLLVQWSMLLVTAPLMAAVLADVDRRSRAIAWALLVPFLVFSILPFNVEEYYVYPGVDGFGIYNRQVCQLLYVLAAALVFVENRTTMLAVLAGTVLALFLVKVTGFIAAVALAAFAFAAGRVPLRTALAAGLLFISVLAALEGFLGVVSAYVRDIVLLVEKNEGSILPRFLQAASIHFIAFGPLGVLTLALLWLTLKDIRDALYGLLRRPSLAAASALVGQDAFWLGTAVFIGLFVETQNTGGLAFIFVWPALLSILARSGRWQGGRLILVLTLVAASSLPTFLEVVQRAGRAFVGQMKYVDLTQVHLGTLGAISQRTEIMARAEAMLNAYRDFPDTWRFLAERGQLPTFTLYTEPDFQVAWLMSVDEAVAAIKAYEAENDVRFSTIMSFNFVNPFPWLLQRHAPLHIAIGADPFRAVPDPDLAVLDSVRGTDLLLYPKCPITSANLELLALYTPGLAGHERIALSPCWDAYVRRGLAIAD